MTSITVDGHTLKVGGHYKSRLDDSRILSITEFLEINGEWAIRFFRTHRFEGEYLTNNNLIIRVRNFIDHSLKYYTLLS